MARRPIKRCSILHILQILLIFGYCSAESEYRKTRSNGNTTVIHYSEYCDLSSSIDDFPKDLFTNAQRERGAVLLHTLGAIYFFTLLAVVVNDYFLPSVEIICEDLNIPKDLAAATFMATATTTPEFFTNVISTFITESDIGLGTIIGSLMFNTLGVAAVASLATHKPVQLDWWPITRDAFLYSCNILLLVAFAWDGQITLNETIVMVVLYFVYFIILFQNRHIMPKVRWLIEKKLHCCKLNSYELPNSFIDKRVANTRYFDTAITKQPPANEIFDSVDKIENGYKLDLTKSTINNDPIFMVYTKDGPKSPASGGILNAEPKKKRKSLWIMPSGDRTRLIWWIYTWPIKLLLTISIPNPKTYRRLYPLTFFMCIIWIGLNAYMIVWMITVMGFTLRIPDVVMGLTFLAAGGCMPEGITSVLSIRKGEGGIGVSNSLGANSLAILMSLGIPWLIKNILHRNSPGKDVIRITSYGIEYTILLLFIAVICLYAVLTIAGYRLKKTVGLALISSYLVLITFGILLELNIFFPWIECPII